MGYERKKSDITNKKKIEDLEEKLLTKALEAPGFNPENIESIERLEYMISDIKTRAIEEAQYLNKKKGAEFDDYVSQELNIGVNDLFRFTASEMGILYTAFNNEYTAFSSDEEIISKKMGIKPKEETEQKMKGNRKRQRKMSSIMREDFEQMFPGHTVDARAKTALEKIRKQGSEDYPWLKPGYPDLQRGPGKNGKLRLVQFKTPDNEDQVNEYSRHTPDRIKAEIATSLIALRLEGIEPDEVVFCPYSYKDMDIKPTWLDIPESFINKVIQAGETYYHDYLKNMEVPKFQSDNKYEHRNTLPRSTRDLVVQAAAINKIVRISSNEEKKIKKSLDESLKEVGVDTSLTEDTTEDESPDKEVINIGDAVKLTWDRKKETNIGRLKKSLDNRKVEEDSYSIKDYDVKEMIRIAEELGIPKSEYEDSKIKRTMRLNAPKETEDLVSAYINEAKGESIQLVNDGIEIQEDGPPNREIDFSDIEEENNEDIEKKMERDLGI